MSRAPTTLAPIRNSLFSCDHSNHSNRGGCGGKIISTHFVSFAPEPLLSYRLVSAKQWRKKAFFFFNVMEPYYIERRKRETFSFSVGGAEQHLGQFSIFSSFYRFLFGSFVSPGCAGGVYHVTLILCIWFSLCPAHLWGKRKEKARTGSSTY